MEPFLGTVEMTSKEADAPQVLDDTKMDIDEGPGSLNGNLNGGDHTMEDQAMQPTAPHTSLSFAPKSEPKDSSPPAPSENSDTSKMKSTTASKKKGTATVKKSGPRKSKSKAKTAKKEAETASTNEDGLAGEATSGDETDNGPYCICRGPDDHRWMIQCEVCEDWFHGQCVHIDKNLGEKLIERFVCPNCTDGKNNYTKYKKACSLRNCTNPARLYSKKESDRSNFCSNEHCDAWWASLINTLPTKAASTKKAEVLTQEDFMGLLAASQEKSGWKLGDSPFGNTEGLWANGLPTRPGILSEDEQNFLVSSSAERLALGNEIVQYKKMLQLLDWAEQRRRSAIEAGTFPKDSCGYDRRLDVVSTRPAFAAWLDSSEGQSVFTSGKLDTPPEADGTQENPVTRGMCEKKRCKAHHNWTKILANVVREQIKETANAAGNKLEAEEILRREAETRYERGKLENNWVEVLQ